MEDTQWSEGERLLGFSFLFVHRSILNSMTSDLLSSSAPDQVGDLVIPVIPEAVSYTHLTLPTIYSV